MLYVTVNTSIILRSHRRNFVGQLQSIVYMQNAGPDICSSAKRFINVVSSMTCVEISQCRRVVEETFLIPDPSARQVSYGRNENRINRSVYRIKGFVSLINNAPVVGVHLAKVTALR